MSMDMDLSAYVHQEESDKRDSGRPRESEDKGDLEDGERTVVPEDHSENTSSFKPSEAPRRPPSYPPTDGGYGWVVVAASFMAHFVALGQTYASGVLFAALIAAFDSDRGTTAWVGSVMIAVMFGSGILIGKIAARFGCRLTVQVGAIVVGVGFLLSSFCTELWMLMITHGVITGFGSGMCFAPSIAIVGHWFKKRRALATGLAVAGSGAGTFAVAPVMQVLIDEYGWEWMMRIMSVAFSITLFLCGTAYRPRIAKDKSVNFFKLLDLSLLKDPTLGLMGFSVFFAAFGYFVPFIHLPKFAVDNGMETTSASLLISYLGASSLIGRVVFGRLADCKCFSKQTLFNVSMGLTGGTTMLVPLFIGLEWALILYVLVFGMFAGAFISLMPVVIADIVGLAKLSQALGLIYSVQAVSMVLGGPSAGWIFESTGNYDMSFYVAGLSIIVGTFFVTMIPCAVRLQSWLRNRKAKREAMRTGAAPEMGIELTSKEAVDRTSDTASSTTATGTAKPSPEKAPVILTVAVMAGQGGPVK